MDTTPSERIQGRSKGGGTGGTFPLLGPEVKKFPRLASYLPVHYQIKNVQFIFPKFCRTETSWTYSADELSTYLCSISVFCADENYPKHFSKIFNRKNSGLIDLVELSTNLCSELLYYVPTVSYKRLKFWPHIMVPPPGPKPCYAPVIWRE